jgi:hypothetical protein
MRQRGRPIWRCRRRWSIVRRALELAEAADGDDDPPETRDTRCRDAQRIQAPQPLDRNWVRVQSNADGEVVAPSGAKHPPKTTFWKAVTGCSWERDLAGNETALGEATEMPRTTSEGGPNNPDARPRRHSWLSAMPFARRWEPTVAVAAISTRRTPAAL